MLKIKELQKRIENLELLVEEQGREIGCLQIENAMFKSILLPEPKKRGRKPKAEQEKKEEPVKKVKTTKSKK